MAKKPIPKPARIAGEKSAGQYMAASRDARKTGDTALASFYKRKAQAAIKRAHPEAG